MAENKKGGFLPGIIIGGFITGAAVFLTKTEEGKKMARTLKKKGVKTLNDLKKELAEISFEPKEIAEKVNEVKETVIKEIRKDTEKVADTVKEQVGTLKEQTEEFKQRFFTKNGKSVS